MENYSLMMFNQSGLKNSPVSSKNEKTTSGEVRANSSIKPFQCSYEDCKKSFSQYSSLQKHERTHNGQKPFICEICSKSFTQISNLRRHERMHNNVRPHTCDICKKNFLTSSNLKQHLQTHVNKEVREKYECSECSRIFHYKSSLKKHQREHKNIPIEDDPVKIENNLEKKIVTESMKGLQPIGNDHIANISRDYQLINQINQSFLISLLAKQIQFQNSINIITNVARPLRIESKLTVCDIMSLEKKIKIKHLNHFDYLIEGRLYHINESIVEEHFLNDISINPVQCKPLKEITHVHSYSTMRANYEIIAKSSGVNIENLTSLSSCTALTCSGPKKIGNMLETLKSDGSKNDVMTFSEMNSSDKETNNCKVILEDKDISECSTAKSCCSSKKSEDGSSCTNCPCCESSKEKLFGLQAEEVDIKDSREIATLEGVKKCCQKTVLTSDGILKKTLKSCCKAKKVDEPVKTVQNSGACCQNPSNKDGCGCGSGNKSKTNSCFCSLTRVLKHSHSQTCGHLFVFHLNHVDFIVEGRLHHPHGEHCDDHGPVEIFEENSTLLNLEEGYQE